MNDGTTYEFETRDYVNPTVSRDEQLEFIDRLRQASDENVARINANTKALGSDLPSNLGGLTGAEATFEARYVTPQTNNIVANLRSVAQQTALTQALSNIQAEEKQRYNDAYRAAKVREYNKANTPTTSATSSEQSGFNTEEVEEDLMSNTLRGAEGKTVTSLGGEVTITDNATGESERYNVNRQTYTDPGYAGWYMVEETDLGNGMKSYRYSKDGRNIIGKVVPAGYKVMFNNATGSLEIVKE